MSMRDPRIDTYIATSAPFAQPILEHLRALVHTACPDVQETIKWSFPHFDYGGMMCSMAAFKAHCAFRFWKGALILEASDTDAAMGQFGRITSVKDLPSPKTITGYIRKAMALNDAGIAVAKPPRAKTPKPVVVPPELAAAFSKSKPAKAAFDALSPSHRREYCEWIADAKREDTKVTRVAKTIAQLRDGKSLNARYESTARSK
ncbi:MAG: YdeI/OmpD-associated family protein [Gemmatimonadaceae bacterium]|nr:YdeI/OmpD-associated family protein [Gemmatimonadaceae bacterium]